MSGGDGPRSQPGKQRLIADWARQIAASLRRLQNDLPEEAESERVESAEAESEAWHLEFVLRPAMATAVILRRFDNPVMAEEPFPLLVALDTSVRMGREGEIWSKALTLALCSVASPRSAAFTLDGGVERGDLRRLLVSRAGEAKSLQALAEGAFAALGAERERRLALIASAHNAGTGDVRAGGRSNATAILLGDRMALRQAAKSCRGFAARVTSPSALTVDEAVRCGALALSATAAP